MTIQDCVDWWATAALTTGVQASSSTFDENLGTNSIMFIAFNSAGVLTGDAANQGRDLYTITGLLMIARGDMKSSLALLRNVPTDIADLIRADPTMGNNAMTYEQITYQFSPSLQWQGVDTVGYVITVTGVKLRPVV